MYIFRDCNITHHNRSNSGWKNTYALDYCEALDAEIISCDASLFYRGMDIGTAKPTKEEMAKVPHHCIDMNSVSQSFDITQFCALARRTDGDILSRVKSVVITGGSGFYLKSFFEPVVDTVEVSDVIRAESESIFANYGLRGLLDRLNAVSPEGLGNLDTLNPRGAASLGALSFIEKIVACFAKRIC